MAARVGWRGFGAGGGGLKVGADYSVHAWGCGGVCMTGCMQPRLRHAHGGVAMRMAESTRADSGPWAAQQQAPALITQQQRLQQRHRAAHLHVIVVPRHRPPLREVEVLRLEPVPQQHVRVQQQDPLLLGAGVLVQPVPDRGGLVVGGVPVLEFGVVRALGQRRGGERGRWGERARVLLCTASFALLSLARAAPSTWQHAAAAAAAHLWRKVRVDVAQHGLRVGGPVLVVAVCHPRERPRLARLAPRKRGGDRLPVLVLGAVRQQQRAHIAGPAVDERRRVSGMHHSERKEDQGQALQDVPGHGCCLAVCARNYCSAAPPSPLARGAATLPRSMPGVDDYVCLCSLSNRAHQLLHEWASSQISIVGLGPVCLATRWTNYRISLLTSCRFDGLIVCAVDIAMRRWAAAYAVVGNQDTPYLCPARRSGAPPVDPPIIAVIAVYTTINQDWTQTRAKPS